MGNFLNIMSSLNIIQNSTKTNIPFSIKSVIAVGAGKGGVGKSTISVNLALALKERGWRVGILDADVYGPSIKQMLPKGLEPVNNPENVERLLPAMAFGMPFISVANFRKEASILRAPLANQIIEQFLDLIDWGDLDFLIIDFPPGTGDIQLTLMQKAAISGALVVTTPQKVSVLDVRKAVQLFQKLHIPILGVVENMSFLEIDGVKTTPFGSGGGALLSEEFGIPLLTQLPLYSKLSELGDEGKSLFKVKDTFEIQSLFFNMAQQIEKQHSKLVNQSLDVRYGASGCLEFLVQNKWKPLSIELIQNHCPCARCREEKKVQNEVGVLEFSLVGRYAVSFQFSSGCSQGIYPFSLINRLLQT